MSTLRRLWHQLSANNRRVETAVPERPASERSLQPLPAPNIAPNDPLLAYFQSSAGVVEIDRLEMDSPALAELKAQGIRLIVPLVSQGELIGLINLGSRRSEQDYSADDRKLLDDLATQAAPAVRVAQLVRQQQIEARERERLEHELRVARLIQQTLLPRELPNLPGYHVSAYYQPAREVGGDFYDFIYFDDGRIALIIGDVTDKGVPAALVMATTRSLLRITAEQRVAPGQVLERVNDLLYPDIPPRMFVTCLYALLDPATGRLQYANAGHDLPYRRGGHGVDEMRATGMPLGLLPGMRYEEKELFLRPGDTVLFHSDGLVEAHSPTREMFGFGRLQELMGQHPGGAALVDYLLAELAAFTGPGWEQEDDVTLVTLECVTIGDPGSGIGEQALSLLAEFEIPSQPGNERQAMEQVAASLAGLALSSARLERLKTAVAEATMNAMEHGNRYQANKPVTIQVLASAAELHVRITDLGGGQPIPEAQTPDLLAKLTGEQTPRGWGLFLIQNMVDQMNVASDDVHHTVELILNLEEGAKDADPTNPV